MIPRNINIDVDPNEEFEPGMFSTAELHFLLEHLRDPPIAAWHEFDPDKTHKGVQAARLKPFHERLYELEELRRHRELPWAGFDAINESIERFLQWQDRSAEIARRSRGVFKHPSMFFWDDTGKAHKYATDADSGEMVRTEILNDGTRRSFKVHLTMKPEDVLQASAADLMPWVKSKKDEIKLDALETNTTGRLGYIRCPICQHTEEFPTASKMAHTQARGRMARHLKRAKEQVNRHRLLYTKAFST